MTIRKRTTKWRQGDSPTSGTNPHIPIHMNYQMTPYGWVAARADHDPSKLMNTFTARHQQFQNATFVGNSGATGYGDRGYGNSLPYWTDNPYSSNDFVYRWRQEVMLYETSWEARKIVRIVPEDALRKDWLAEGIPEEMSSAIWNRLEQIQFLSVLKRSLMLERLLGGCLTFLGIESESDNPEKTYHPRDGRKLRFCNSIPISRIARVTWDFNPLSEGYMRPSMYLINGTNVHVSRCLVWDGEPLFDPYDFALTNFRANLAGFGPSKLASVWDDIVKAVGARQAAYQLIQMNNAILAAISDLQDLQGSNPGQAALDKIKSVINQISLYRAAIFDGEKVEISQHSASFGSVPELLIMYLQVLAAASDIPATRFLGEAPGGLNATGKSDLENYYNVIDAYQRQRIQPQLRRIYDVIGFNLFPGRWGQERESLAFKFPPMWNATELEEAQRNQITIANMSQLLQERMITEDRALEELIAKKVFTIKLDEKDFALLAELKEEAQIEQEDPQPPVDAGNEIQKLRNVWSVPEKVENGEGYDDLIRSAGGDPARFDSRQIAKGLSVEQEHFSTTGGDETQMMRIVLDHLQERSDYYDRLEAIENATEFKESEHPRDESGKFEEGSGSSKQSDASESLREFEKGA